MGGSGSTRRITVEDARGEDFVTISEAVARRIKGQAESYEANAESSQAAPLPSPTKLPDNNERISALLSRDEDDFYTQKLKDLQERNAALQKQTNEEFAKAVKEVEAKFLKDSTSAVCQDLQLKVLECYQTNPNEILNCSGIVDAFTTCVERARMMSWQRAGNEVSTVRLLGGGDEPLEQHHFPE